MWRNYDTIILRSMNYKSTFITTHPSEYLSVKGAEKLRVPSSRLVDLMLDIVKTVCSIVENLGDDEGTFPRRSKLV